MSDDITAETLAQALTKARAAALAADPGENNDGGSCNLDSPTVRLKGIKSSSIRKAQEISGVSLDGPMRGGFWRGSYFVRTPEYGQANRRSTMAEAACKSLRESGLDACMFCHAD